MSDSHTESIPKLVIEFLGTAKDSEGNSFDSATRQADLMYELDTLVSDFIDQNEMSANEFNNLEQQVLNSIAETLIREDSTENDNDELGLNHDNLGNFDAESVLTALDSSLTEELIDVENNAFEINGIEN